ncbi:hypothetical protein PC9H_002583 [Pleurotus ostreatus]|uniref:Uncharacterized protein n=1 Tax=Pleurotus ostreatus TaxID=5322 RepID=A0A8H6ZLU9_PLEOS|nr:uncharacterized protein PC9H_002583 [Pleurotus ostreatus]KAF7416318.1 hypothetical protein PC9H_002583 [Pleurotus ostreatus]
MAQPTQELPPWFTASVDTLLGADGVPFTTSTTLLFLPLTYYGPSIPLGPDWTYGGLTSPASTSSTPISTATPTITATPTPTATPSESITSFPSSSSTSNVITLSTASTSDVAPTPTMASASRGTPSLIGIIVGSVFGGIFLLFVLALYICLSRRKHRTSQPRFSFVDPSDDEFYVVGSNDLPPRRPGSGSPRESGDEIDPFLTQQRSQPQIEQTGPTVALVTPRRRQPAVAPPSGNLPQNRPVSGAQTMSSVGSGTSGSNSGYGTLVDVPTLAMAAGLAGGAYAQDNDDSAAEYYQRRGPILTPGELSRLDEETSEARHEEARGYSPLIPPPPLNPDQFGVRGASATSLPRPGTPAFLSDVPPQTSQGSLDTKRSSYPVDADEANTATVLTARRVRVEDLGPRSPLSEKSASPQSPSVPLLADNEAPRRRGSGAWLAGLGLGSLAGSLGRLSWFKGDSSARSSAQYAGPSTRRPSEYVPRALSDDEYEAGHAELLDPEKNNEDAGLLHPTARMAEVGRGVEGDRPISSVSAKSAASGTTVYHDAQSSLGNSSRGVPSPAPPSRPTPSPPAVPVPRSRTPHSQGQRNSGYYARDSGYGYGQPESASQDPPSYNDSNSINPSPRASYPGATAIALDAPLLAPPPLHTSPYDDPISPGIDILDLPAPSPLLPHHRIATVGPITLRASDSAGVLSSTTSDGDGDRSVRIKEGLLMPPGLWQDTSTITSGSGRDTEGEATSTGTRGGMDTPSFGSLALQMQAHHHQRLASAAAGAGGNGGGGGGGDEEGISIDVLEELPPSAGEGWRSLAQAHGASAAAGRFYSDFERRRTFGMPPHAHIIHPQSLTISEQGSLHSMRSHLSPQNSIAGSGRSSGSAPASASSASHSNNSHLHLHSPRQTRGQRLFGSTNSNSSHSHSSSSRYMHDQNDGSMLSTQGSFVRSRPGTGGGSVLISPALSAFGHGTLSDEHYSPPLSPLSPHSPMSPASPTLSPLLSSSPGLAMPQQAYHQRRPSTAPAGIGGVGVGVGTGLTVENAQRQRNGDRPASPPSSIGIGSVPWAGGLDHDWTPAA